MGKLEPITGMKTKWEGLWWHPENMSFSSATISLADLRKFKGNVRLVVRKNRFYNNGMNGRPNYHFSLMDANSPTARSLEVDECDGYRDKLEELREVMRQGKANGDKMMLPSESAANADMLIRRAVALIEEITGEEWDFSYITL